MTFPLFFRKNAPVRTDVMAGEISDLTVESEVRQRDAERHVELLRNPVPTVNASLNLAYVVVTQTRIKRGQGRHLLVDYLPILNFLHRVDIAGKRMIVIDFRFFVAALYPPGEKPARVRGS